MHQLFSAPNCPGERSNHRQSCLGALFPVRAIDGVATLRACFHEKGAQKGFDGERR